jgi:oligoendopeptidase F
MSKKLPVWDLSEYYKGVDDPNIEKDIKKYQKLAVEFNKKYEGRIKNLSIEEFRKALNDLEKMRDVGHRLGGFAHLNFSTNMLDSKAVALNQKVEEELTKAGTNLVFWSLEYNKLSEKKQNELIKNLNEYAPYLKRLRKYKKYELTEDVEKTLLEKDITSGSAWVRFYEESMARLDYVVDGKTYNDAEMSKLTTSSDEKVRLKAGREMNRVSKENAFMLAFCYNMIMKDKAIEDEKRGFKLPMSSRNLSEDVADEVVECLANSVKENY